MTRAVKNSPIAKAERRAMVHREFHRHLSFNDVLEGFFENGISADQGGRDADYADVRKGLPKRNHTAIAAKNTKAMRTSSAHSTPCPCSSRSEPGSGSFGSGEFRVSLRCGGLASDFSTMGEELIATFPPWYESDIPSKTRPFRSLRARQHKLCPAPLQRNRAMNRYHSAIRCNDDSSTSTLADVENTTPPK